MRGVAERFAPLCHCLSRLAVADAKERNKYAADFSHPSCVEVVEAAAVIISNCVTPHRATRQPGKIAIVRPGLGLAPPLPEAEHAIAESFPVNFLAPLALAAVVAASLGIPGAAGERPVVIGAIYNLTG